MDIFSEFPYDKDCSITECFFSNLQTLKPAVIDEFSSSAKNHFEKDDFEKINSISENGKSRTSVKQEDDIDMFVKLAFDEKYVPNNPNNDSNSSFYENIFNEKQPFEENDSVISIISSTNNKFQESNNQESPLIRQISPKVCKTTIAEQKPQTDINSLKCSLKDVTKHSHQIPNAEKSKQLSLFQLPNETRKKSNVPMLSFKNKETQPNIMNRRKSVIGINANKTKYESMPNFPSGLVKSKSISLNSLNFNKRNDYGHVESKVKQYIKKIKQTNAKKPASKSLPNTPSKEKISSSCKIHPKNSQSIFVLTQEHIDNIGLTLKECSDKSMKNEDQLKDEIYTYLNNPSKSKPLIESLIDNLKAEKKKSQGQCTTLKTLQSNYEALLAKYAQAENVIDKFRIYKGTQTAENCYASSSRNSIESSQSGVSKYSNYQNIYPLKKALSTSNIYLDCSLPKDRNLFPQTNLVKYPSSPNVDQFELKSNSVARPRSHDASKNPRDNNQSYDYSVDHKEYDALANWYAKLEELFPKIKDYATLEETSALDSNDRMVIWAHIQEKFKTLENLMLYQCYTMDMKEKYNQVDSALKILAQKYHRRSVSPNEVHRRSVSPNEVHRRSVSPNEVQINTCLEGDDSSSRRRNGYNDTSFSNQQRNVRRISYKEQSIQMPNKDNIWDLSASSVPEVVNTSVLSEEPTSPVPIPPKKHFVQAEPSTSNYQIGVPNSECGYYLSISKKANFKDNDSGYLPSDRSNYMRNSRSQSVHSENSYNMGELSNRRPSRPSSIQLKHSSPIHQFSRNNFPLHKKNSDADDDSSSSSSDFRIDQKHKKLTKKRNSPKKSSKAKSYDTKFPRHFKVPLTVEDQQCSGHRRFRPKDIKIEPSISHFEKHSRVFKAQMRDLKAREVERLQQYSMSPIGSRSPTPVKPLKTHQRNWKPFYDLNQEDNRVWSRDDVHRYQVKVSQRDTLRHSNPNLFEEQHDDTFSYPNRRRSFQATSMVALNESPEPCSPQPPFIYINKYSHRCESPKHSCFCENGHSKLCRTHSKSFENIDSRANCHIMESLDESTLLAKHLKHRSQSLLSVLKK